MVLHNMIGYSKLGLDEPKQKLIKAAVETFKKNSSGGFLRITPGSFNNEIWPKFKSAAHFWAASVAINTLDNIGGAFPCRPDELGRFLSDAEAYRIAGETTRTKQAATTILDPGVTIRLPDALKISPSELVFVPKSVTK